MQTAPLPSAAASLHSLLSGLIDYAGLFPPASLSLDASIRNYARYLRDPDRWMLGRFICPAARLSELPPYVAELFGAGEPLVVSALGRGSADASDFEQNLRADVDAIESFRSAGGDRTIVDVLEMRIPEPAGQAAAPIVELLARHCSAAQLRPFAEIGFAGDWRAIVPGIAQALAEHGVGYKLRSGGVEASAFPSAEQIALAIIACRDAGVAMKFTAGLHHPLRHFNDGVDTKMHGFLNVFVACVLARTSEFDEQQVRAVLEDEDPCCFRFRDWGLSFGEHAVSTDQIAAVRRDFAISFGSCSFDEPRQDLRELELLP